jgi:hypothetical protein
VIAAVPEREREYLLGLGSERCGAHRGEPKLRAADITEFAADRARGTIPVCCLALKTTVGRPLVGREAETALITSLLDGSRQRVRRWCCAASRTPANLVC